MLVGIGKMFVIRNGLPMWISKGVLIMGAVNYFTSDYITMGIKLYSTYDFESDRDFMEMAQEYIDECGGTLESWINNYINTCYEDDTLNVSAILKKYSFRYYHVAIQPGYYEGFTLDIKNNFSVAFFDTWKDKREAQKEITSLKKCLLDCAGVGMVQCSPGWCTGCNDYKGTCKAIEAAIKVMREEVKNTPTWAQYERESV